MSMLRKFEFQCGDTDNKQTTTIKKSKNNEYWERAAEYSGQHIREALFQRKKFELASLKKRRH